MSEGINFWQLDTPQTGLYEYCLRKHVASFYWKGRAMLWRKFVLTAASAVVATAFVSSSAPAAVLYDSEGFETPPFVNNSALEGQDPVDGPWFTDNNVSSATVQSGVKASGSQAVQVTRNGSANADQRWAVSKPITPSERYVIVEWDQLTLQTSQFGVSFGPVFGIEAYDAVGNSFPLIGAAGVDSTTGDLLFQAENTGFYTESGVVVPFNQWHHFAMQLDYNTSSYQVFFNGTQVVSEGFVDGPILGFSDAPIATVRGSDDGNDPTATGTAYFDNYLLYTSSSPVPEPASFGLMAMAAVALLRRSR